MRQAPEAAAPALSAQDIRRIAGDIIDAKVVAILETGITADELEQVVAWAAGESDVLGEAELPLSGRVSQVHEILTADEGWAEEERGE